MVHQWLEPLYQYVVDLCRIDPLSEAFCLIFDHNIIIRRLYKFIYIKSHICGRNKNQSTDGS